MFVRKKTAALLLFLLFSVSLPAALAGCGGRPAFSAAQAIHPVTREEGSGTRSAFVDLFALEEKRPDGTRKGLITKEAGVETNTNTILATVSGDLYAIGYISMGALDGSVRALAIDGAAGSVDAVKSGAYQIVRPFRIVLSGEPVGVAGDFVEFILSGEGQAVAAKYYIAIDDGAPAYTGGRPAGRLVVGGSSSVAPLMEKLIEAYERLNPNAQIQLQTTDSTTGIAKTADGVYDIGMSSRELTDGEQAALRDHPIALDGIAVIVNPHNSVTALTSVQIKGIFSGEITHWEGVTP
jgi:phosphate transport system substrate-binding protein